MKILEGLPEIGSLTLEQETALARKRTTAAKNEIVMANMREAFVYCKKCCRAALSDDDIYSLCYGALQKAIHNFDPKRGRFFAYVKVYLRGYISREWKSKDVVKNASLHENKEIIKVDPRHGPDIYERGEPVEAYENGDPLWRDRAVDPEFDAIHTAERWAMVEPALKVLSERERMVIEFTYRSGFGFPKIGELLGISRQAVGMVHNRALKKIRNELMRQKQLFTL